MSKIRYVPELGAGKVEQCQLLVFGIGHDLLDGLPLGKSIWITAPLEQFSGTFLQGFSRSRFLRVQGLFGLLPSGILRHNKIDPWKDCFYLASG
jgi:hypothetical protein